MHLEAIIERNAGKVEITEQEYRSLQADATKLAALEDAGVDNWEWYDEAMKAYECFMNAEALVASGELHQNDEEE